MKEAGSCVAEGVEEIRGTEAGSVPEGRDVDLLDSEQDLFIQAVIPGASGFYIRGRQV